MWRYVVSDENNCGLKISVLKINLKIYTDCMVPRYDFSMNLMTTIPYKGMDEWCWSPSKGLRRNLHWWIQVGRNILWWNFFEVNRCSRIYKDNGLLQAAVKIIWDSNIPSEDITILSDSKASIRALGFNGMNSKMVYDCRKLLNKVVKIYKVHIIWVPGHNNIPGNCRA